MLTANHTASRALALAYAPGGARLPHPRYCSLVVLLVLVLATVRLMVCAPQAVRLKAQPQAGGVQQLVHAQAAAAAVVRQGVGQLPL